ncbi:MAG: tetratricopeptide repeat protein [Acidobacteriaceae bacterium]|nr:tetratricopeptide repeat protein [Acidobacteriaceae bacterium]
MKSFLVAGLAVFALRASSPTSPNFARDIAPIIYSKCSACHYSGGPGPFPLTSYEEIRKHAQQIADVTRRRFMPPWLPEHGYGEFADELRLTEAQIQCIASWVLAGAPEGPPEAEPVAPSYMERWRLGPPDLIVKAAQPFQVPVDGTDVFWNFILKPPVTRTRYVRAIDIRPSNPKIVHHANMIIDRLGSEESRERTPGSGFPGMDVAVLGSPMDIDGHPLFWKPGTIPFSEPPGMAWRLDPGNDLILNVHIQPSGKAVLEQPIVGLYFTDEAPTRFPYLLELEHDGALDIRAGDRRFVVSDSMRLPIDTEVIAVYPHAHYLGKLLDAWATLPTGTRQWLIRIPDWDQSWQAVYRYRSPLHLAAGTVVTMRYEYDNSAANPRNPSHPPKRVRGGNNATDEMGHLWLEVLPEHGRDARRTYAEAWARHQLEKYPDSYDADVTLGAVALSRLETQQAIAPLERAVALRPDDAIAHNLYGSALEASGRTAEAVQQFRDAISMNPDFANARFNLAHALMRSGKKQAALDQLAKILASHPEDQAAGEYLEELKEIR